MLSEYTVVNFHGLAEHRDVIATPRKKDKNKKTKMSRNPYDQVRIKEGF